MLCGRLCAVADKNGEEKMRMRPGFHTDLQVIFGMLKCRQDAEKLREYVEQHREYFESVDLETYQAVRELLRSEKILRDARKDRKETGVNMCKACLLYTSPSPRDS